MSDQNKEIDSRIPLEAFNQGRLEVIDQVLSADFVDHSQLPPGVPSGREGVKALVKALRTAFPDFKATIERQIAEGDFVVQHVTATGTMKGDFAGMPASGKRASWQAIHISRLANGKVVEHWSVQDQLGMLQQLGFAPKPEAAAQQAKEPVAAKR
jgi:steroid delta-isomerase-like uncharacterized protein